MNDIKKKSIWDFFWCWGARNAKEVHDTRTIQIGQYYSAAAPPSDDIGSTHPPSSASNIPGINKFPNNRIVTAKYSLWNFIPKNLFQQFRRIANFYFLCVAIIQLVSDSPVSPFTSISPLVFVVLVTACKQVYEDWLRHKADDEVNKRLVKVVRNGQLEAIRSQDIRVGDIVKVLSNEGFPCDLVMLSSDNADGNCHITTANLDGETNLKMMSSCSQTKQLQSEESLNQLRATVKCQPPSDDLYRFVGTFTVMEPRKGDAIKTSSLGAENLLLRGASLRNTEFIYGCAVYTGQETKMGQNSKVTSSKFSTVERTMNYYLVIFLILLLAEVTFCLVLRYRDFYSNMATAWYLPPKKEVSAELVINDWLGFLVLYNYIIPISMYVTIEMQKFFGSMFFEWDEQLFDERTNQRAKCNSSDLNEELGQVEYLFTDKTGTLTENEMLFRHCSIDGARFIEHNDVLCHVPKYFGDEPQRVRLLQPNVEEFLLVLSLCHTVHVNEAHHDIEVDPDNIVTTDYISPNSVPKPEYQASSPDEKALVEACRRFGVIFHGVKGGYSQLSYCGVWRQYKLLHVLEFDCVRKCMSVIVETPAGEIYLMCKGAESAVVERCTKGLIVETLQHVNDYALLGLRTLVVAHKRLSVEEYSKFNEALTRARNSLQHRDEEVAKTFDSIERNMKLLGATGVEDRLQDGVPETLESLKVAGIKIWILTGDKLETAVNISYSTGHFKRGMTVLRLVAASDSAQCREVLEDLHRKICSDRLQNYGLVVDGTSLVWALIHHRLLFREIGIICQAVVCCRMSPIQKAEVVKLIKSHVSQPVTAAIGDGANDCSMILEAHVGLGLMGKEGRQAVRCSDFAFARFRFLQRVFLVHGHYYYVRVSTLVQYFFYKNIAFITPQLLYAFFSAMSEQPLYDSVFLTLYNVMFSSLPILIYGLVEKDYSAKVLQHNPRIYKILRRNARLSSFEFIKWVTLGFWHAVVFFFGAYLLFDDEKAGFSNGQTLGYWCFGTLICHTCVFTVNLKLAIESQHYTSLYVFSILLSTFGYMAVACVYSSADLSAVTSSNNLYWVYLMLFASPTVWFSSFVTISIALIPDLVVAALSKHDFKIRASVKNFLFTSRYTSNLIFAFSNNRHGRVDFLANSVKLASRKLDY